MESNHKQTFNPLDWIDFDASARPVSEREGGNYEGDAGSDVERVIRQIEEKKIDITEKYEHWRNIGFGLASAFGEAGRDYFHRVSCFYPRYTKAECDKQYTSCVKGKKSGITLKSFFYYAKEKGVDVSGGQLVTGKDQPATVNRQLASANKQLAKENKEIAVVVNGDSSDDGSNDVSKIEEKGSHVKGMEKGIVVKAEASGERIKRAVGQNPVQEEAEEWLPNIPAGIYDELPLFLKKVVAHAGSNEEKDLLLLGSLAVLSSCLPTFYGMYDGKMVHANLYLFVTARASAGKGRLVHCRQLVQPIHGYLRDQTKLLKKEYDILLAEYNQDKGSEGGEKPNKPAEKMLFIPANSSTTGVFQLLHENEGRGIIFEMEGDTMAQAFKSDYGNYSDGFRKAFHHETISYYRRTDREYVDIESPSLSTVLSGTPKQVAALIPSAENGLFSRFIFYYMNIKPVWKDVFSFKAEESLDVYFRKLGQEFFELYKQLLEQEDVKFVLTDQQQAQFNQFFTIVQDTYVSLKGIDYLATVRRLGLIAFRISMIFSALRLMEHGEFSNNIVCEDRDFQAALNMTKTLVKHAAKVFSELPEEELLPIRNNRKERFFESLPKVFGRKDYLAVAVRAGIPDKTADRYIADFIKSRIISNDDWGQYSKSISSELPI